MVSIIQQILRDIPQLEEQRINLLKYSKGSGWTIIDNDSDTYLLMFEEYEFDPLLHATGRSGIAIVFYDGTRFRLFHIENYSYKTILGFLDKPTSNAVFVRLEERDDTVEFREGSDDIYVVDYVRNQSHSVEPFYFDIGSYHGGNIKVALNRTRNWIAFARDERYGWQDKAKIVVCIYDLADSKLFINSELSGISSVNSIDLPGVADFLIITDATRKDHAYEITETGLIELKRSQSTKARWQIALSFAGEDRQVAERLAMGFKEEGISVFYDKFEKYNLIGKDLYQYLFDVYSKHSEYCVILISQSYVSKSWTMHELKAMQSAALLRKQEYILPVRLDGTEIPGLPPQIGYLDFRRESVDSVVDIISKKVKDEEP